MKILNVLKGLNWRTFYLNFKYLRYKDAVRLPIIVSNHCLLKEVSGSVEIKGEIRTGMIRFGFGEVGIFDEKKERSIWQVQGKVVFNGGSTFGHGSRISVGKSGTLIVGNQFSVTGASSIVCYKKIVLGNQSAIAWDVLLMDTDFHNIYNESGEIINPTKEINIGENVWVGCKVTILKGVIIDSGNIIASGSFLTKTIPGKNQIVGGNPPRVLKENVSWVM